MLQEISLFIQLVLNGGILYHELFSHFIFIRGMGLFHVDLSDNYICGKQYTFHLGLDLGTLYQPIEFTASVGEWENSYSVDLNSVWGENKIYEDNNYF